MKFFFPISLFLVIPLASLLAYRDLETGAFLTRDPAGFVDGPNLYAYVKQNPWTSFDPEGLQTFPAPSALPPDFSTWSDTDRSIYLNGQVQGMGKGGEYLLRGAAGVVNHTAKPLLGWATKTPGSPEQAAAVQNTFRAISHVPGSDPSISSQQEFESFKASLTTPEGVGGWIGVALMGKGVSMLGGSARSNALLNEAYTSIETAAIGTKVSRNWGGKSGPDGESWTTMEFSAQSREGLGLANSNTGEFLSFGTITSGADLSVRQALPWGGFRGNGNEVLVPKPQQKMTLEAVVMPDSPLPDKPKNSN